jgi:hypothetical protein
MGSQRVAKLSPNRGLKLYASMKEADITPRPVKGVEIPASVAVRAIGKFTPSGAFVQCLAGASTKAGLKLLTEFANTLRLSDENPDEILSRYGIDPENKRPASEFIEKAIENLREDLTEQSRSTETAIAVEFALARTVIDLLDRYLPREEARTATREQFIKAFRKAHSRTIVNIAMEHVISGLINRILDAARGNELPRKTQQLKRKISENFVPKLIGEIDRLAREKGIQPTEIPSRIPDWAEQLEEFAKKYRINEN